MKRFALPAILCLVALSACSSSDKKTTEPTASKVTIKTTEYAFTAPQTFGGGLVELTLDNTGGKEAHEAELIRIDAGKTIDDFKATIGADDPPPSWQHASGGPGPVPPGKTSTFTANVDAGTYVLVCHLPAADGTEHVEKGMIAQTSVTAGTNGTLPTADLSLTTSEFKFGGTELLKAGSQTIRVANEGQQMHHIAVIEMAPGKKAADLATFFGTDAPAGPPPFAGFPGLVATMPPGYEGVRDMELTAGTTYVLVCFIPDTDGAPHFAKGMVAEVTPA